MELAKCGEEAERVARSVEELMTKLRSALSEMTTATGQYVDVHAESVDEMAAIVQEAEAKNASFLHRIKELEHAFSDVDRMSMQLKQIRKEVDNFEELLTRPPR